MNEVEYFIWEFVAIQHIVRVAVPHCCLQDVSKYFNIYFIIFICYYLMNIFKISLRIIVTL